MSMTKAELADSVYALVGGFSKKEAGDLVDALFELMKETLATGVKLKITGFGNFVVRDKKPRLGRNPRTHEEILLPARRVVRFRPSPVLKAVLNGERALEDASDDDE